MKNTIKVFVLVALTLAAMSVSAQVKLGHIETQKLIQAMPEWTAAQKTFEEEQKKVNTELNGLREQFQTKLAEYSEKMKTYSEAMRATTEEELQGLQLSNLGMGCMRLRCRRCANPAFSGNGYGSAGKNTE